MGVRLCLVVFVGCFVGNIWAESTSGTLSRLIHSLMANYDKIIRPENPMNVSHGLNLMRIESLEDQVLTLNTWQSMQWKDERLMWEPKDFDGIDQIRIPSRLLWLPDMVLYNSVDEVGGTFGNDLNAIISNKGDITYVPPTKTRSSCQYKSRMMKRHHRVTCQLKIGSWTYDRSIIDTFNPIGNIDLSTYVPSLTWKLGASSVEREVQKYACCDEEYVNLKYQLTIKYLGY